MTKQQTVHGEEVETECTYETRDRPDVRFSGQHFVLKCKAHSLRRWRKNKDDFRDFIAGKIKPKKSAKSIPDGVWEDESTEIVSAALHADLPDADPDWSRREL